MSESSLLAIDTFLYGARTGLHEIMYYAIHTLGYNYKNNPEGNRTAMELAIKNCKTDIVEILYENGTKIDAHLFLCCLENYHQSIIEYILENANFEGQAEQYLDCLHIICDNTNISFKVFKMFINKINLDVNKGLNIAVNTGNRKIASFFCDKGAKLTDDFYTAFDEAADNINYDTVKYFIQHPDFNIHKTQYPSGTLSSIVHCLASNGTFTCSLKDGKYIIEITPSHDNDSESDNDSKTTVVPLGISGGVPLRKTDFNLAGNSDSDSDKDRDYDDYDSASDSESEATTDGLLCISGGVRIRKKLYIGTNFNVGGISESANNDSDKDENAIECYSTTMSIKHLIKRFENQ